VVLAGAVAAITLWKRKLWIRSQVQLVYGNGKWALPSIYVGNSRHLGIDSLYVRHVCQASSRPYRKLLVRISHIADGCKMFIISSVHTKILKTSLWQCRELNKGHYNVHSNSASLGISFQLLIRKYKSEPKKKRRGQEKDTDPPHTCQCNKNLQIYCREQHILSYFREQHL
jgi:hypothetical protein